MISENGYDFEKLNISLTQNAEDIERAIADFFADKSEKGDLEIIKRAQCYSLVGAGKRIRPFLVNETCKALGGSLDASMPFALAVEMIHTYSLIHDDLPCMDDDDLRRGKPTNHKVFGEATAVMAGDALLTNAFLAAVKNDSVSAQIKTDAIRLLSIAAGDEGMIGGQIKDMEGEKRSLSFDELLSLHSLKTGKMIEVSVALGCLAAGYDEDSSEYASMTSYARKIGVAFQAIDDLLDVVGDEQTVGKTLCSDADNQKTTFLTFFDIDGVRAYAQKMSAEAIEDISDIPNTEMLKTLAVFLLNREK